MADSNAPSPDAAQAPRALGNYRLLKPIGFGGMGEVWEARHVSMDQPAAIKLLTRRLDAPGARDELRGRFEREVKAMARLTSPHTVQIYDYGSTDDGTLYYAMELLDGLDFRTLVIRHGPLPAGRVVRLLHQACESLAEAHAAGLVHRDIKPANLYACRLGVRHDVVKLLDFGLVKLALEGSSDDQLTRGLSPLGTLAFMSPEVIEGRDDVDHRADIYGLGCVAYWLLTGTLVFEAKSEIQLLAAHLKSEPVAPSVRAVDVDIPPELDAVVLRCLAKLPSDRPADVADLARALKACDVAGEWTELNAERWFREHVPRSEETTEPISPTVGIAELKESALPAAREEVLAALRREFVYSGFGFSEMEYRVDRARRADNTSDLERLVADLRERPVLTLKASPTAPVPVNPAALVVRQPKPVAPRDSTILLALFSGDDRRGIWRVPETVRSVAVFGGNRIDLRDAQLQPGLTVISCLSVFGTTEILIPPDLYVEVDGFGLFGGFGRPKRERLEPLADGESWVRVTGLALFGGVKVRSRETWREKRERRRLNR